MNISSLEQFLIRFRYHEHGEGNSLMLVGPVLMDIFYVYELSLRIWNAAVAAQWCAPRSMRIDDYFVRGAYFFIEPEERETTTASLLAESFEDRNGKAIPGSLSSLHEEIVYYMISLVDWHRQYDMGNMDDAGKVILADDVSRVSVFYCSKDGCDKSYSLPNIFCPQHQAEENVEKFPATYQEILNMAGMDEWEAEDSSGAVCPHGNYFELDSVKNDECGCRNPMEKIELLTLPSTIV